MNAKDQAISQYDSVRRMVRALDEETYREDFVKRMDREARIAYLRDVLDYPDDERRVLTADSDTTMVDIIKGGPEPDDYSFDEEAARETIQGDALEVSVRSGWYTPGHKVPPPEEFSILLCTGGPAVRIIGELDQHNQPEYARIEYQDWGTPWTGLTEGVDRGVLLTYCQQFWFGN